MAVTSAAWKSQRDLASTGVIDPEDGETQWLFETVEDEERRVAIKQIVVTLRERSTVTGGSTSRDEGGFEADQPIDYTDELRGISPDEFLGLWRG